MYETVVLPPLDLYFLCQGRSEQELEIPAAGFKQIYETTQFFKWLFLWIFNSWLFLWLLNSWFVLTHLTNEGERFRIIGRVRWRITRKLIFPHLSKLLRLLEWDGCSFVMSVLVWALGDHLLKRESVVRELHWVSLCSAFDRGLLSSWVCRKFYSSTGKWYFFGPKSVPR